MCLVFVCVCVCCVCVCFFFQAEDGIRDSPVTGVQTCALPIFPGASADFMSNNVADKLISAATGLESVKTMNTDCQEGSCKLQIFFKDNVSEVKYASLMNNLRSKVEEIGRASCRERV